MALEVKVIRSGDIDRCPKRSMLPGHYRPDGTCRCPRPEPADDGRCSHGYFRSGGVGTCPMPLSEHDGEG